jgi:hypothetical protein
VTLKILNLFIFFEFIFNSIYLIKKNILITKKKIPTLWVPYVEKPLRKEDVNKKNKNIKIKSFFLGITFIKIIEPNTKIIREKKLAIILIKI